MPNEATATFKGEMTGADAPQQTPQQIAADEAARARANGTSPEPKTKEEVDADNSPEGIAKALADTKAALTKAQQELAAIKKPEDKKVDDTANKDDANKTDQQKTDDAAKAAVESAGLDVSQWQTEFNETRDVSEKGRKEIAEGLAKAGVFGKDADYQSIVNDFIDGRKALNANYDNAVMGIAGGEKQYGEMMQWASKALSPADRAAYDKAVDSRDLTSATMAVESLKARFERENGKTPNLIGGDNSVADTGVQGFASAFEMQQAMRDPRYAADPVYREGVMAKAVRSNF